jgi:hypothetical protein
LVAHLKAHGRPEGGVADAEGLADVVLNGPLAHLQLKGSVAWQDAKEAKADSQTLQLEGELAPFESWPVPRLVAQASRLDLSHLLASLPRTALSGQIDVVPPCRSLG